MVGVFGGLSLATHCVPGEPKQTKHWNHCESWYLYGIFIHNQAYVVYLNSMEGDT